jgi:hypothetical protein
VPFEYRAISRRACRDDLPDGESGIFLQRGLDRQIKQPVRQQIAGWVERFAKPIAVVQNMMGIVLLYPCYALIF